jgi:error-prone DNA polymerase
MTVSGEVVADYRNLGPTLRSHPVSFLRAELQARRIVSCVEAMAARDGCWLEAAGVVLVRQRCRLPTCPSSRRGTGSESSSAA